MSKTDQLFFNNVTMLLQVHVEKHNKNQSHRHVTLDSCDPDMTSSIKQGKR